MIHFFFRCSILFVPCRSQDIVDNGAKPASAASGGCGGGEVGGDTLIVCERVV